LRQLAISAESNLFLENDIQQLIKPKAKEKPFMTSSTEESYV